MSQFLLLQIWENSFDIMHMYSGKELIGAGYKVEELWKISIQEFHYVRKISSYLAGASWMASHCFPVYVNYFDTTKNLHLTLIAPRLRKG